MKLVDYEKYYHSGSEFIIPRDEFEKIIEENQRLNNVLNELEKWLIDLKTPKTNYWGDRGYTYMLKIDVILDKLNELKESDK